MCICSAVSAGPGRDPDRARRGKGALRELDVAHALPEAAGGALVGVEEAEIGRSEGSSHRRRRGMNQRRRTFLDPVRLEMRVLAADSVAIERRLSGLFLATSRRDLDLLDQLLDSLAMDRRLQRSPTRERSAGELLALDEGSWIQGQALTPRLGLERLVLPPTGDGRALGECSSAVDSGPVERRGDESLFDSMRQQAGQPIRRFPQALGGRFNQSKGGNIGRQLGGC